MQMLLCFVFICFRANGGAVVAEQLAPYLDVPLPNEISTTNLVQENYMLPVLSTFNGRPEVQLN